LSRPMMFSIRGPRPVAIVFPDLRAIKAGRIRGICRPRRHGHSQRTSSADKRFSRMANGFAGSRHQKSSRDFFVKRRSLNAFQHSSIHKFRLFPQRLLRIQRRSIAARRG
jgi:hypothetical protein